MDNALKSKNGNLASSSKKTIQNLEKMIDFINVQLVEKVRQMESLEIALQNKDAKIDELRYNLNERVHKGRMPCLRFVLTQKKTS